MAMTSVPGAAVEVAGGLVREDERRVRHQRSSDGHALLLAAGELGGLVVHAVAQAQADAAHLRPSCVASPRARPGT